MRFSINYGLNAMLEKVADVFRVRTTRNYFLFRAFSDAASGPSSLKIPDDQPR